MHLTAREQSGFDTLAAPILADDLVQGMDAYVQHGSVSTLDHCLNVARTSFWANRRLHLHCDEKALVTGALLHDFYLYDWHGSGWRHSYLHPRRARANAVKHFGVDEKVQNVIASHMWPLTLLHAPHCREALLVSLADKACSAHETLLQRHKARPLCG